MGGLPRCEEALRIYRIELKGELQVSIPLDFYHRNLQNRVERQPSERLHGVLGEPVPNLQNRVESIVATRETVLVATRNLQNRVERLSEYYRVRGHAALNLQNRVERY